MPGDSDWIININHQVCCEFYGTLSSTVKVCYGPMGRCQTLYSSWQRETVSPSLWPWNFEFADDVYPQKSVLNLLMEKIGSKPCLSESRRFFKVCTEFPFGIWFGLGKQINGTLSQFPKIWNGGNAVRPPRILFPKIFWANLPLRGVSLLFQIIDSKKSIVAVHHSCPPFVDQLYIIYIS
jgi:hypothetical protein